MNAGLERTTNASRVESDVLEYAQSKAEEGWSKVSSVLFPL